MRHAFSEVNAGSLKVHLEASELTTWLRSVMLEEVPVVEHVNGRLDTSFGFEDHYTRGRPR